MNVELTPRQRADGTRLLAVTQGIGRALIRSLSRAEIVGSATIPQAGGVLFAANHSHIVDGPLLYGAIPRPVVFFVKAEVFVGPIGLLLRRIGQIPVTRGVAEREPLLTALATLAAGGAVGIFPEGTRGAGDVASVRHGIAYLAVRSGCPVVPIACAGTEHILMHRPWSRPPVRIVFGEPVRPAAGARASRSHISEVAEQIRTALADLVVRTDEERE